jgi:branched-chain amino acid transport system substrate-binding protein
MEIAIEEINARRREVEGKTYQLQLIMYDDQYTGAGRQGRGRTAGRQDNVKFIIGPVGSPPALRASSASPIRPR